MKLDKKKIKSLEKIITRGYLTRSEMDPILKTGNIDYLKTDDVTPLVRKYGFSKNPGLVGQMYDSGKSLVDKLCHYSTALIGGAAGAEYMAAKTLSDTLLAGKLVGTLAHVKFWLGLESVALTGPEMASAMYAMAAATPQIMIGLGVGVAIGYLSYSLCKAFLKKTSNRVSRRHAINNVLNSYSTG